MERKKKGGVFSFLFFLFREKSIDFFGFSLSFLFPPHRSPNSGGGRESLLLTGDGDLDPSGLFFFFTWEGRWEQSRGRARLFVRAGAAECACAVAELFCPLLLLLRSFVGLSGLSCLLAG